MKIGPFLLLPGALAIESPAPIEEWEQSAREIFDMQRYVPWWLGDMVVFGESQFGDEIWQAIPMDVSEQMLMRFAGVARKYPPDERVESLSWTHHMVALRIPNHILRRSLLRIAERDGMDTKDFTSLVNKSLEEANA